MAWYHIAAAGWILCTSLISFFLCGWDKRCSKRPGVRRVPERTLFGWALAGGSLGLWLGMQLFRHKTRHWYFVWGVPAIFVLEGAALAAWHLLVFCR
ncbi:MAG TPA: DUF1294 domain-containing protein [Candidatus Anaerofilum excrementigallinarum]|nr:DUF1294 domain-containing protein [Candidatus Anaerofilum excrementigallinarum]